MKKQVKTSKNKVGGIVLGILTLALIFPTISKANLQSRPGATSLINKTESEFFLLCRQMETLSGPLGLNATIEVQSDKVEETSDPNGIDVHMIKNTEYGTAAMLSASAYGNCPVGYSGSGFIDSTTGNDSGIKDMASGMPEYVAGIYYNPGSNTNNDLRYIINAEDKYKDVYKSTYADSGFKSGDATYETPKWKGAVSNSFCNSIYPIFFRAGRGMFDFYSMKGEYHTNGGHSSRAAVVCGEKF